VLDSLHALHQVPALRDTAIAAVESAFEDLEGEARRRAQPEALESASRETVRKCTMGDAGFVGPGLPAALESCDNMARASADRPRRRGFEHLTSDSVSHLSRSGAERKETTMASSFRYDCLSKDDAAVLLVDHQSGLISLVRDYSRGGPSRAPSGDLQEWVLPLEGDGFRDPRSSPVSFSGDERRSNRRASGVRRCLRARRPHRCEPRRPAPTRGHGCPLVGSRRDLGARLRRSGRCTGTRGPAWKLRWQAVFDSEAPCP